jgi:hypothetical protein
MIGLDPDLVWRCRGDRAEIKRGESAFVARGATPVSTVSGR